MRKLVLLLLLWVALFLSGMTFSALLMLAISVMVLYLGLVKRQMPVLLLPLGFGILLANLPGAGLSSGSAKVYLVSQGLYNEHWRLIPEEGARFQILGDSLAEVGRDSGGFYMYIVRDGVMLTSDRPSLLNRLSVNGARVHEEGTRLNEGDLLQFGQSSWRVMVERGWVGQLYAALLKTGILPPLLFLVLGLATDFGLLFRRIKLLLLGIAVQFGIFSAFLLSLVFGFSTREAASAGLLGSADLPSALYASVFMAPHLAGSIGTVCVVLIVLLPYVMSQLLNRFCSRDELQIQAGEETVREREAGSLFNLLFPVLLVIVCGLFFHSIAVLTGMLMLGYLLRVSGLVPNLGGEAALPNALAGLLAFFSGAAMDGGFFFSLQTLLLFALGFFSLLLSIMAGIWGAKAYNLIAKSMGWDLLNPLAGASVSAALPLAAGEAGRFLPTNGEDSPVLAECLAANMAGLIGSILAAGYFLSFVG